jgi:GTP cyclohydrolase II
MKNNYFLLILFFSIFLILAFFIYYFKTRSSNKIQSWSKSVLLVKNEEKEINCTVYCFKINNKDEWALVYGNPQLDKYPIVRLQSQCITGIELDDTECDCKQNLKFSKRILNDNPNGGVLYILNQDGRSYGGVLKLTDIEMRRQNIPQKEIIKKLNHGDWDSRNYNFIPETLEIMGLNNSIRLVTRFPEKVVDLKNSGVNVVEIIPYEYSVNKNNYNYLKMKKSFGYNFNIV